MSLNALFINLEFSQSDSWTIRSGS